MNIKGKELPQLNARQYKTLANEVLMSSGLPEENYPRLIPGLYLTPGDEAFIRYSHDYNWQDDIFTNSVNRDAHFSIMGGDAIGRYALSVGYLDHEGIFRNSSFSRFTSRFTGTFNMFEWLRVSVSANLVTSSSLLKESGLNRASSPIITSLAKSPMQFPYKYDNNNNQLNIIEDVDEMGISNPEAVMDLFEAKNSSTRFLTSFMVEGDITSDLSMNSLVALNINSLRQNAFYPNKGMELYQNLEVWNSSQIMTGNLFSMFNDNYLTYRKTLNIKHRIDIMAGAKWMTNRFEEDFALAKNLNPNDHFIFLQAGSNILNEIGGDIRNWNWLSAYSRINYSLLDRYLFEVNASADLSSNVGREAPGVFLINDLPYGAFYSGAFSWRIGQENFLRNLHFLDDLRFNVEYAITGNDDIGTRNRHDHYRLLLYRETSGMIPAGNANPALGYEKSRLYSAGTEARLFGNRFRFSFDYHHVAFSDLLIYENLSSFIGDNNFPSNNASMVNRGYEIHGFGRVINTPDFNLDLGFNIARIENEITDIKGGQMVTEMPGFAVINRIGENANSFYGFIYEGIFASTEEARAANLVNSVGVPFRAGDVVYRDISGPEGVPDGIINDYDKVPLGSGRPDVFGGTELNISYKNWSLSSLWQFALGNDIFNYVRFQNEKMTDLSNQSITTLRRWSYEGHETDIPKARWGDPVGNSAFSSRWIDDGSYLRCKNIILAYNLPEGIFMLRDLTVFTYMVNPFTFTRYIGYDPEFSYSFHNFSQGVDYGLMPLSRQVMAGVKIGL
jgi:TonB-linked SusC/RagA family outer membrane protein